MFKSFKKPNLDWTIAPRFMTGLFIFVAVLTVVVFILEWIHYNNYADVFWSESARFGIIEIIEFIRIRIYIIVLIINGIWIYKASSTAIRLNRGRYNISPEFAVAYFLIPIVNIWAPFLAIRQLWNLSVAREGPIDAAAPPLFWFWWLTWLAVLALNQSVSKLTQANDWGAVYGDYIVHSLAGGVFEVLSAVCFLRIQGEVISALKAIEDRKDVAA